MNRCPGVYVSEYPYRLKVMHIMFGKVDGETCKACKHLIRHNAGGSWLKCDLTVQRVTPWRLRAVGMTWLKWREGDYYEIY